MVFGYPSYFGTALPDYVFIKVNDQVLHLSVNIKYLGVCQPKIMFVQFFVVIWDYVVYTWLLFELYSVRNSWNKQKKKK